MKKLIIGLMVLLLVLAGTTVIPSAVRAECGDDSDELCVEVEVQEEACICIEVDPACLDFGVVYAGQTSTLTDAITIGNCGNVDVTVTASTPSAFFQNNLYFEGSSWDLVGDWQEDVLEGQDLTIDAEVRVPTGTFIGLITGTVTFWAEEK